MTSTHSSKRGMGIALRIALLPWMVTLIILLIFVLMFTGSKPNTFSIRPV